MWVTGFADAEGSFVVSIAKRKGSDSLSMRASFEIGLNKKDILILHEIQDFFSPEGDPVGRVTARKSLATAGFAVNKISHLMEIIIPHFEKYPLQTQKRVDFEI